VFSKGKNKLKRAGYGGFLYPDASSKGLMELSKVTIEKEGDSHVKQALET
jgi:hypothetical protein